MMKRKITIVLLFLGLYLQSSDKAYSIYLIVNTSNSISSLSKGELRNIFLGNTINWNNNKKIQLVDYNSELELRESFSTKYLNLAPGKVSMIWLKVTLSGKVIPPKIFYKEKDVIRFVSDNVEAIGYISSKSDLPSDVKIIEIRP